MENNTPETLPVQPTPPAAPQPAEVEQKSSSSKIILWFVIGLVVVVVLVLGIYFLLNTQQASTPKETAVIQTPVPSPREDLEGDLNSINVDTSTNSSDFTSVDQDLEQL